MLSVLSCQEEENDFIPEPTATSVIITGQITSTGGEVLSDVPVSIDYMEQIGIHYLKTIHKAKAKTDKDGKFRLFFEPETPEKVDSYYYNLCADLKDLPEAKYVVPSDFEMNNSNVALASYYKFDKGEKLTFDARIPLKKIMQVRLIGYANDNELIMYNRFPYGGSAATVTAPISFTSDGEASATIVCALNETNKLTLCYSNGRELDRQEVYVAAESNDIVFDNTAVPDEYRFKLTKSGYRPFMNDNFTIPAPMEGLTFRITDAYDRYAIEFPKFVEYYDSIVWCAEGLPETVRIYESRNYDTGAEKRFTSQWSSHFFQGGVIESSLLGYRNGTAVHKSSLTLQLVQRNFLCYDWTKGSVVISNPSCMTAYCLLDTRYEYQLVDTQEKDGIRYARIEAANSKHISDMIFLVTSQASLRKLMEENIGQAQKVTGKAEQFHCLPEGDEALQYWENTSTRILLMHHAATDSSTEVYYLHAEMK